MKPILPGSTIGVLGSGQLGRMFTIAARRLGYRVHTFSPETDTPTGQVADLEITASYDDLDAVRKFASNVSVVTFEFENVPSATTAAALEKTPVRPSGEVLHITQHRLREKTFLKEKGFPVTPFRAIKSKEDLSVIPAKAGIQMDPGFHRGDYFPGVLKTAGFGYDGKGQSKVSSLDEALKAYQPGAEFILEEFIDLEYEVSVIAVRGLDGTKVNYGIIRNDHQNHILDVSTAPANVPEALKKQAIEISYGIMDALNVVGVMCVEFFVSSDGQLMVNELAPRPHNSGHLTIDACMTSQFEQQLRAVCGLPLGSTEWIRPAAMANLLGDLWSTGEPDWEAVCKMPSVRLHLYGKSEARPGRKMGHLTALGSTPQEARMHVIQARAGLHHSK